MARNGNRITHSPLLPLYIPYDGQDFFAGITQNSRCVLEVVSAKPNTEFNLSQFEILAFNFKCVNEYH